MAHYVVHLKNRQRGNAQSNEIIRAGPLAPQLPGGPVSIERLRKSNGTSTYRNNTLLGVGPMLYYRLMKRFPLIIATILLLCCYANAQSTVDLGTVRDGIYINNGFGFSFKYPKDWVVHGEATKERIKEIGKERVTEAGALSKPSAEVAMNNTYQLLTVFRHPLGTPGIAFNPAVLVSAERVDHAPGITSGKEYLLNIRTLMLKMSHQALFKDPMENRFAGWQFFRDDYAGEINGVHMLISYFANVANGYALVFAFIAEDQKSLDEVTKSMETITLLPAVPTVRRGVTTINGSPPQRKPN
jgi:hypothetical protein